MNDPTAAESQTRDGNFPLWHCPGCGLALGYVTRTRERGVQVSRLHLFCKPAHEKLPAVIAVTIWPLTVHCLGCGAERKWGLDEEVMLRLVKSKL